MSEKLVEIKNLSLGYNGKIVIKNASFDINSTDFIGIIGPNGGGKTTLIKGILGLLKPKNGKIEYPGLSGSEKKIGYLPQINNFDYKFPISVFDVVLSGLSSRKHILAKQSKAEKEKALDLLEQLGIYNLRKKPIGELSGGQMQRVFLCRSLISEPKLLILDEPNTYVDNKFESDLYEKLSELSKNVSILIVSHDVGTISYYIKSIICVNTEVHVHQSNRITEQQLASYNCPLQIITHGDIPHTVLKKHNH